jgi:histidinol-phosphate aminotransferase
MQFDSKLQHIKTYEAGKPIELVVRDYGIRPSEIIKLASNENPYGTSPKVTEALKESAHKAYLYPDDSMYALKESLAKRFNVTPQNLIIGAGSDQVIEFVIHAKANATAKVLTAKTTFAMYDIYAKTAGAEVIKTASDEHDLEQFLQLYQQESDIGIIFLCMPNNPLGESLDKEAIYDFLDQIDSNTLVVIDGAYQEYAAHKDPAKQIDPHDLIERYENALYLGTFSKAYSLGGMRVGYGIASSSIIHNLYKLRPPFNVTTLSLVAAEAALQDEAFVQKSISNNFTQMKRYEEFAENFGLKFIDSYTNFITIVLNDDKNSSDIAQNLLKQGIIIRDLKSYGLNAVRITIGTKEQNDRLFEKFSTFFT